MKKSILVSPASPENAIKVCLFSSLVLSSEALRIVAPLIAALEAAMMVKSLPVMPRRTSLKKEFRQPLAFRYSFDSSRASLCSHLNDLNLLEG